MNKRVYFPAQEPTPEELNGTVTDLELNLANRALDILQRGIVDGPAIYAESNNPAWQFIGNFNLVANPGGLLNQITVQEGLAYDSAGNRIRVAPGNVQWDLNNLVKPTGISAPSPTTYATSTGNSGILLSSSTDYYVYIRYLAAVDTLAAGGDPVNNYTVDPDTGLIGFTKRIDGYHIHVSTTVSADALDVLIGYAEVDGSGTVTVYDLDARDTSFPSGISERRTYAVVSSAMVTAVAPAAPGDVTLTYDPGQRVSVQEHIQAAGDATAITADNPHGVIMDVIPGLNERFGAYSDNPSNFQTDGVVDTLGDTPGPYWVSGEELSVPYNIWAVNVEPPIAGQFAYISGTEFSVGTPKYSSYYDGATVDPISDPSFWRCDFHPTDAAGYYYICLTQYTLSGTPGLLVVAVRPTEQNLNVLLTDRPEVPADHMVIGIVHNAGSAVLDAITDPQTGKSPTFNALDARRFGTISPTQISHDKRFYTGASGEVPEMTNLSANREIYSDIVRWIVQGDAAVTTTYPVVQSVVKKSGRVRKVYVFSDTIPTGANLEINICRNGSSDGLANSVFTQRPAITAAVAANTTNRAGASSARYMWVTEEAPTGSAVGQLSTTTNLVNAGDRLQLFITSVGSGAPGVAIGGDDLLVMVYIE
jgi:hypothetical protein